MKYLLTIFIVISCPIFSTNELDINQEYVDILNKKIKECDEQICIYEEWISNDCDVNSIVKCEEIDSQKSIKSAYEYSLNQYLKTH